MYLIIILLFLSFPIFYVYPISQGVYILPVILFLIFVGRGYYSQYRRGCTLPSDIVCNIQGRGKWYNSAYHRRCRPPCDTVLNIQEGRGWYCSPYHKGCSLLCDIIVISREEEDNITPHITGASPPRDMILFIISGVGERIILFLIPQGVYTSVILFIISSGGDNITPHIAGRSHPLVMLFVISRGERMILVPISQKVYTFLWYWS